MQSIKNMRNPLTMILITISALSLIFLPACGSSGGSQTGNGSSAEEPVDTTFPVLADLPDDPGRYIDVTGDQTIILTAQGETVAINAVVRSIADDRVIDAASITFESSNTAVATVSPQGLVEAQTSSAGSTAVTLSTEDAFDVVVTAAVVELTSQTTFVQSSNVVAYDDEVGTLTVPTNLGIAAGDIVVSGEQAGVLVRILNEITTDASAGTTTFSVEDAVLGDAVAAMDVEILGPPVRTRNTLADASVSTVLTETGNATPSALAGFTCEKENGDGANINIEGSDLDYDFAFRPNYALRTTGFTVDLLRISFVGTASLSAATGTLTLASDLNGKVTCEREFSAVPLAFVGILGPLGVASTATPSFGFEIEATADVGQIAITGPNVDTGARVTAGLRYTDDGGFTGFSNRGTFGDGLEWGTYEGDLTGAFEAKLGPFLKVTLAASANLGPRSIASFDFADVKAGGTADIALSAPLDPLAQAYTGPRWNFKVNASAGLGPLVENVQSGIGPLLEFLSIEEGIPEGLGEDLFSFERSLATSPQPKAEASANTLTGNELSLVASDAGSGSVRFIGFVTENGVASQTGSVIIEADAEDGLAHARWKPGGLQAGVNEVRARAYEAPFASLGLPYAKDQGWLFAESVQRRASVELPDPDGVSRNTEVSNAVSFNENTIDEDITQLRVTWSDGQDDQVEIVSRGPQIENGLLFEFEPTTTFSQSGLNYQVFSIETLDGTYIDDRSVPVFVGGLWPEAQWDGSLFPGQVSISNLDGNNQDFTFSVAEGVPDPELTLVRGQRYTFRNFASTSFWIKTANVAGEGSALGEADGVTLNGWNNGRRLIVFEVPNDAPDTLFYRSEEFPEMNGVINIVGP